MNDIKLKHMQNPHSLTYVVTYYIRCKCIVFTVKCTHIQYATIIIGCSSSYGLIPLAT